MNDKNEKNKIWPRKVLKLLWQLGLLVVVLLTVTWWQARDSLQPAGQVAPDFILTDLSGTTHQLSRYQGKHVLLYFFAPWCGICRYSAANLNELRAARSNEEWVILTVALDYADRAAVEDFVDETGLEVPVLLGTQQQSVDYKIQGFPTYYVLNQQGQLIRQSIGYSTELGLRFRAR